MLPAPSRPYSKEVPPSLSLSVLPLFPCLYRGGGTFELAKIVKRRKRARRVTGGLLVLFVPPPFACSVALRYRGRVQGLVGKRGSRRGTCTRFRTRRRFAETV